MRTISWVFTVLVLAGWAGYVIRSVVVDGANPAVAWKLLYGDSGLWSGPGWVDWLCVGLAVVSVATTLRRIAPPSQRALRVALTVGAALVIVGGAVWWLSHSAAAQTADQLPAPRPGGALTTRPNLSRVVLGHHYQVPETGGLVFFADGAVQNLTREQFLAAEKAAPPEYEGAVRVNPSKAPHDPNLGGNPPTGGDPTEVIRRAELRSAVASDLKVLAEAYYRFNEENYRPPLGPSDLNAPARLIAAVNDGTYIIYFGWGLGPPSAIKTNAELRQYLLYRWVGFQVFGVGLVLLAGWWGGWLGSRAAPQTGTQTRHAPDA